jgi:hypothetical protein
MLTLPLPLLVQNHWSLKFVREAMTMRLALIGAGFLTVISVGLIAANMVAAQAAFCGADESLLVYPTYSSKGIVAGQTETCGQPHRSCKIRDMNAANPIYDCSPFMAPKSMR